MRKGKLKNRGNWKAGVISQLNQEKFGGVRAIQVKVVNTFLEKLIQLLHILDTRASFGYKKDEFRRRIPFQMKFSSDRKTENERYS